MEAIAQFIKPFFGKGSEEAKFPLNSIHKIGRKYFLITDDVMQFKQRITREVYAAGLYLGECKGDFRPSPALIELIARKSPRKAVISKQAEWLFLCGRDVFDDSILTSAVNEGVVLVQNEEDENLGYGELVLRGRKYTIKNILDRGSYLRQGNEKKK